MMEDRDNQSNLLKGFLIGGIVGGLVGILFAPKAGKQLRSEIKEKGSKVLKDSEEIYQEATAVLDDVQHHAEELNKELVKVRQMAKQILIRSEKKEM